MAGVTSQQRSRQTFFYDYGRRPQRGPDGLAGAYLPSKNLYNAIGKLSAKNVTKKENLLVGEVSRKKPGMGPTASERNMSQFEVVKKRLRAAAYSNGKVDWGHLFRYYDKDNSGRIEWEEFRAAIRKSARITAASMPDKDLRMLYDTVDIDGDGSVDYMAEFVPWLSGEDDKSSQTGSQRSVPTRVVRQGNRQAADPPGGIEQQQALAAQELFARMDVNKTGALTFKDFERGLQRRSLAGKFEQVVKKEAWPSSDGRRGSVRQPSSRQGAGDPLNLQEPPMTGDPGIEEDDYEMLLADGDYEAAGLNPDSAVADIESLLAQEKLLGEQTKWWEDRLKTEAAARKAFQAEMKAQDSQFSREVRDLQDLISELRSEQAEAEEQAHFLVCEAKDYENEASVASREVEMLKPKIADLRKSIFTSPRSITSKGASPMGPQRSILTGDKQANASNAGTPSQPKSGAQTPAESAGAPRSEQGSQGPVQGSRDKSPSEEPLGTETFDMNDMFGGGMNKTASSRSNKGMDASSSAPSRNAGNGNKASEPPAGNQMAGTDSMDFDFLGGGGAGAPAPKAAASAKAGNFGPADSMDFEGLMGGGDTAPTGTTAPAGGGMPFMAMDTDMLGGDAMDFMNIK